MAQKKRRKKTTKRKHRVSFKSRRIKTRSQKKLEPNSSQPTLESLARNKDEYILNPDFEFLDELRALTLKASPAERNSLVRRISRLGAVKLAIVSGILMNSQDNSDASTALADLFIVADDVDKQRLSRFLKSLEAEVGTEIKFGLMDKQEFDYRYNMFDRFVRVLLESPHDKLINKIGIS